MSYPTASSWPRVVLGLCWMLLAGKCEQVSAQFLLNVDFGAPVTWSGQGTAAVGRNEKDPWHGYSSEDALESRSRELSVVTGNRAVTKVSIRVTQARGVWGNTGGHPMINSYLYGDNRKPMILHVEGLPAGTYHFYLYGWSAADALPEQQSQFGLLIGDEDSVPIPSVRLDPSHALPSWRSPYYPRWFRNIEVRDGQPIRILTRSGDQGVPVLNGLQILSLGSRPPGPDDLAGWGEVSDIRTNLWMGSALLQAKLGSRQVSWNVRLDVEAPTTNTTRTILFRGDLALKVKELPEGWWMVRERDRHVLVTTRPDRGRLEFELISPVTRDEDWNRTGFQGPIAPVVRIEADAGEEEQQFQLYTGILVDLDGKPQGPASVTSTSNFERPAVGRRLTANLGSDGRLDLAWRARAAERSRESVILATSEMQVSVSPIGIQTRTRLDYEILLTPVAEVLVALPRGQRLTQVTGEDIRDWQVRESESDANTTELRVQWAVPKLGSAKVDLVTEWSEVSVPGEITLNFPEPMGVRREGGRIHLRANDVIAQVQPGDNLQQLSPVGAAFASYGFHTRPTELSVRLSPMRPEVRVQTEVDVVVRETLVESQHTLNLDIQRVGLYAMTLQLPEGRRVTEVAAEDVDDWRQEGDQLLISITKRWIGSQQIRVTLESPLASAADNLVLAPLRMMGARQESTRMGVRGDPGIELRSVQITGAREIPVATLPNPGSAQLGYRSDEEEWSVELGIRKLEPRVLAEVFQTVTVGEGVVGGSSIIRYGIVNQGIQQFRVRVPSGWRNVEFTGPGIRRRDLSDDVWTLSMQDKVWEGYTLVITYEASVEESRSVLEVGGAHPLDVERETGALAVTRASNLEVRVVEASPMLRPMDSSELAPADRAMLVRPPLLAYRYEGTDLRLMLELSRHEEMPLLDAVADRAQFTSVLTENGEMLTEAAFMVKNNERVYQRFKLPSNADLWGVSVDGNPARADQDGAWVVVALPRSGDGEQTFRIDLKYAQRVGTPGRFYPKKLRLLAPQTDVPGTFAEWVLHVPVSRKFVGLGGTMSEQRGTTYGWYEAWTGFTGFYQRLWHKMGPTIVVVTAVLLMITAALRFGRRRGFEGVLKVLAVTAILTVLAGMLLPALARAKSKAETIRSINNLKNIGLAARIHASESDGRFPDSLDRLEREIPAAILADPLTGQRYTYLGAGKTESDTHGILAYSPIRENGFREVLWLDGSVTVMSAADFDAALSSSMDSLMAGGTGGRGPSRSATVPLSLDARDSVPPASPAPPQAAPRPPPVVASTVDDTRAPSATGIRSLQFELPKGGRQVSFTRLLGVEDNPPEISLRLLSARVHAVSRAVFQLGLFLFGCGLILVQWNREEPRAWILAVGFGFALFAVADLFIAWRLLHWILILTCPAFLLLAMVYWVWDRWKASGSESSDDPSPPSAGSSPPATGSTGPLNSPPVVTGLTSGLGLMLWVGFSVLLGGALSPAAAQAQPHAERVSSQTQTDSSPRILPATSRAVGLESIAFEGTAREGSIVLQTSLHLRSGMPNQRIPLFGAEVVLLDFEIVRGSAEVWAENGQFGVELPQAGAVEIALSLGVPVRAEGDRRHLEFGMPPVLGGTFRLRFPNENIEIIESSALAWDMTRTPGATTVDATLSGRDNFQIQWRPRRRDLAEIPTVATGEQTARFRIDPGVVLMNAALVWNVQQGESQGVQVRLPRGHRALRVVGQNVRGWDWSSESESDTEDTPEDEVLWIQFREPIRAGQRSEIHFQSERLLEPGVDTVELEGIHMLETMRQTNRFAVETSAELNLSVREFSGLERVNIAETPDLFAVESNGAMPRIETGLLGAWRQIGPNPRVRIGLEPLRTQVTVTSNHRYIVAPDTLEIDAEFQYDIRRLGVFQLRWSLPSEGILETVDCAGMLDWVEREQDGQRWLDIRFRERTLGEIGVRLVWRQPWQEVPQPLPLPVIRPIEGNRQSGHILVASGAGVAVKVNALQGLTEIPVTSVPSVRRPEIGSAPNSSGLPARVQENVLAFRWLSSRDEAQEPWRVVLDTEKLDPWIRAETLTGIRLSESRISGQTWIRFDIQNAPVRELHVQVPEDWQHVDVLGAGIRSRVRTEDGWRIELQSAVLGSYRLQFLWEQTRSEGQSISLVGTVALDAEQETGAVVLTTTSQVQVETGVVSEQLVRTDVREVPAWAGDIPTHVGGVAVLAYRSLRSGWEIEARIRRLDEVALLQGLIDGLQVKTVISEDGQFMTQMQLRVRSSGRQNLSITLPSSVRLWSAMADGYGVRLTRNGNRWLIPLERSNAEQTPIPVELTFVGPARFPRRSGTLHLQLPGFDLPLKDVRWELYLPPDFAYGKFRGTVAFESAETVLVTHDFTLAEYRRQEYVKQVALVQQAQELLSRTREEVATGEFFNTIQLGNYRDISGLNTKDALGMIQGDVQRSQGRQLIEAEQGFTALNRFRYGMSRVPSDKPVSAEEERRRVEVAGRQVQQLQKAQLVEESRPISLSANLPTRGLRHVFSQPMLAETGRPLEVRMAVKSQRHSTVIGSVLKWGAGFMVLWVLAAGCVVWKRERPDG